MKNNYVLKHICFQYLQYFLVCEKIIKMMALNIVWENRVQSVSFYF